MTYRTHAILSIARAMLLLGTGFTISKLVIGTVHNESEWMILLYAFIAIVGSGMLGLIGTTEYYEDKIADMKRKGAFL